MTYPPCPRCGSTSVDYTTIGWDLTNPSFNPNKAHCWSCGHTGNTGDWWLIANARSILLELKPWKVLE